MNPFDEFVQIAQTLAEANVKYVLIGGVALAFYDEPRYTQDIDILIEAAELPGIKNILEDRGYFESSAPWTFKSTKLTLHRFLKNIGEELDYLIDVLTAGTEEHRQIIRNAIAVDSQLGVVRVAAKQDLIRLKKMRNSKQDQLDIERLENAQD